jgi:hypothetical protein
METSNVLAAVAEAQRFIQRVAEWQATGQQQNFYNSTETYMEYRGKESGALRRASLDLTQALSKMRNS